MSTKGQKKQQPKRLDDQHQQEQSESLDGPDIVTLKYDTEINQELSQFALPFITSFSSGPKVDQLLSSTSKDPVALKLVRQSQSSSQRRLGLTAENSKIQIQGYQESPYDQQGQQFLLGVRKGNKMKLFSTYNGLNLTHIVKRAPERMQQNLVDESEGLKGMQRKELLVQEMGTKKSHKILKQMQNKIIEEENINSSSALREIFKEQGKDIMESLEQDSQGVLHKELERRRQFLPDFNPSAKVASKVYRVSSVIPPQHFEIVCQIPEDDLPPIHPYVQTLYEGLYSKQKEEDQTEFRAQLVYLSYLMIVCKSKQIKGDLKEAAVEKSIVSSIFNDLISKFFQQILSSDVNEPQRYGRSQELNLKLESYILVLALLIQGCKMDASPLMKWLRVDEQHLIMVLKEIGCVVSKKESQIIAKLKPINLKQKMDEAKARNKGKKK